MHRAVADREISNFDFPPNRVLNGDHDWAMGPASVKFEETVHENSSNGAGGPQRCSSIGQGT